MRGIDVSHHQQAEDIDWSRLKNEDEVEFCYIRASYGQRVDSEALDHARACEEDEINYGFYHFYRHHQDLNSQLGAFTSVIERASPDLLPVLDVKANKYDPKVTNWALYSEHAWIVGSQLSEDTNFVLYVSPSDYAKLRPVPAHDDPPWYQSPFLALWIAHWDVQTPNSPRPYALWQRGVKKFKGAPYDLDWNEGEPPSIQKAKPEPEFSAVPLTVGECLFMWPDGSLRREKWESGE